MRPPQPCPISKIREARQRTPNGTPNERQSTPKSTPARQSTPRYAKGMACHFLVGNVKARQKHASTPKERQSTPARQNYEYLVACQRLSQLSPQFASFAENFTNLSHPRLLPSREKTKGEDRKSASGRLDGHDDGQIHGHRFDRRWPSLVVLDHRQQLPTIR